MTEAERAAKARDGPTCRRCGAPLEGRMASKHHRKKRRHADADRVENIVTLCGSGVTGCHGACHASKTQQLMHDEGWVCWSWEDPAVRPCLTTDGRWLVFGADGSVTGLGQPRL